MNHILVFTTAYLPKVGGAEVAIHEITKRLSNKYRFTIITYRFSTSHKARESEGGVDIIRLGNGSKFDRFFIFPFRAFWETRKIFKKKPIHLLWAVMVTYASIGAYFTKKLSPSLPFLLTLQEGDSESHIEKAKLGLIGFWWKRLIRKADHVQVISTYLKTLAERNGARKVTVVPNGVDLEKFKNQNSKIKNFDQNSKVIITTSRLVYKNGIDTLIKAIAELSKKLPATNYKLRIVGDGPLMNELKNLTKSLNVVDIVEFAGEVLPDKIPQELASADIFVRPSRSEGLGISFLEAMAAGLPVIATNVGGIPDFLHPLPESLPPGGGGKGEGEANGIFCKVDDPRDLAEKLKLLIEDKQLAKRLGEAGRKLIEASYSWNLIAHRIEEIYESTAAV